MINIGNLLDACGISYTERQLVKLDKLVNKLLNQLSLQQFVSNETTKHDSIPYSRTKDFASKIEITPSQHSIQEFNIELEPCYNNTIMDEIPEENEIETKEECLKDPFASIETINNSKDFSDMEHEENVESNNSRVPIIEKTSNFKYKFCNEDLISKNKLNWHISQVHNSSPPIRKGTPKEYENEVREEFANDPFASSETINNSEGICDTIHENYNSNNENKGNRKPVKLQNGTKLILNDQGCILVTKSEDLRPKMSNAEVLSTTLSVTGTMCTGQKIDPLGDVLPRKERTPEELMFTETLLPEHVSEPDKDTKYKKPYMSFAQLIAEALNNAPEQTLVLSDIYKAINTKYPYYKLETRGWQNSIRHNLTLNENFIKNGKNWELSKDVPKSLLETKQKYFKDRRKTSDNQCSCCWVEVHRPGLFKHEEACAKKTAKITNIRPRTSLSEINRLKNNRFCLRCDQKFCSRR